MEIQENNRPLAAVVCGFAGGGTTMLTEILRQHPRLDSGFEGGFLLVDEAPEFLTLEPYCRVLKDSWQVSDETLKKICSVNTWPSVYRRLRQNSPIIKDKSVQLFDKTPRYMTCLTKVLKQVPNVPCIALVRDPRAVFWTRIKRTFKNAPEGMSIVEWAEVDFDAGMRGYLSHASGLQAVLDSDLKDQVLLVSYEHLCMEQQAEAQKIFDFLGLNFNSNFLSFSDGKGRYRPCRDEQINSSYLIEYQENLAPEICQKILDMTSQFKHLWYSPENLVNI